MKTIILQYPTKDEPFFALYPDTPTGKTAFYRSRTAETSEPQALKQAIEFTNTMMELTELPIALRVQE